jgi:hypothetical protein
LKMFVRKKKNKSGIVSIQIIDKSGGKYKLVKTIGSSADDSQIDLLLRQSEAFIKNRIGQREFDFTHTDELFAKFISCISLQAPVMLTTRGRFK